MKSPHPQFGTCHDTLAFPHLPSTLDGRWETRVLRQPFPLCPFTNHEDVNVGLGFQAFQTHSEFIAARVGALSRANKEDGVLVPGAHIYPLAV